MVLSRYIYGDDYKPNEKFTEKEISTVVKYFRYKNDKSNELLVKLFQEPYANNNRRIRRIYDAIEFNLNMIEEILGLSREEEVYEDKPTQ